MEAAGSSEIIDHVNVVFVPTGATLPGPLAAALASRFNLALAYQNGFSVYARRDSPSP
jgi:hypothetical protein